MMNCLPPRRAGEQSKAEITAFKALVDLKDYLQQVYFLLSRFHGQQIIKKCLSGRHTQTCSLTYAGTQADTHKRVHAQRHGDTHSRTHAHNFMTIP